MLQPQKKEEEEIKDDSKQFAELGRARELVEQKIYTDFNTGQGTTAGANAKWGNPWGDQTQSREKIFNYFYQPNTGRAEQTATTRAHNVRQLKYTGQTRLPLAITDQYRNIQVNMSMGIFPEINRAWVAIDNRLFLWNYNSLEGQSFSTYEGLEQVIVTCALVRPKLGIFHDKVKYLLAVATPVEVVLIALLFDGDDVERQIYGDIHFRPTPFSVPSDNVLMLKMAGLPNGRIFMAGSDGNLYELSYEQDESLASYLTSGLIGERKVKKVKHSGGGIVAAVVPQFLMGLAKGESKLIDLVIDKERHLLYTLAESSEIKMYDLGEKGVYSSKCTDLTLVDLHVRSIFDDASKFCASREAGVNVLSGNVQLKAEVFSQKTDKNGQLKRKFELVSLSVVPTSESSDFHLVAVSSTGIRFYLRAYGQQGRGRKSIGKLGLQISHIRMPPTFCKHEPQDGERDLEPEEQTRLGYEPDTHTNEKQGAETLQDVTVAHYSKGVLLVAEGGEGTVAAAGSQPQRLVVGFCRDSGKVRPGTEHSGQVSPNNNVGLCDTVDWHDSADAVFDIAEARAPDLRNALAASESCTAAQVRAMSGTAKVGKENQGASGGSNNDWRKKLAEGQRPLVVSELCEQYVSEQRRFLCLSKYNLQTMAKLRPIDQLFALLMEQKHALVEQFFGLYTHEEGCAMCFSLACGVPFDVGSLPQRARYAGIGNTYTRTASDQGILRGHALQAIAKYGKPAKHNGGGGGGGNIGQISSSVISSSRQSGLLIFLGRLLNRVWSHPVVSSLLPLDGETMEPTDPPVGTKRPNPANTSVEPPTKKGKAKKVSYVAFTKQTLQSIQQPLLQLEELLHDTTDEQRPGHTTYGIDSLPNLNVLAAQQAELQVQLQNAGGQLPGGQVLALQGGFNQGMMTQQQQQQQLMLGMGGGGNNQMLQQNGHEYSEHQRNMYEQVRLQQQLEAAKRQQQAVIRKDEAERMKCIRRMVRSCSQAIWLLTELTKLGELPFNADTMKVAGTPPLSCCPPPPFSFPPPVH
jgi:hypothetical protein